MHALLKMVPSFGPKRSANAWLQGCLDVSYCLYCVPCLDKASVHNIIVVEILLSLPVYSISCS